ncbi:fructose-1,6-bisphosphatase I / sedoheptulose-1,7-bisphosphatase [Methylophilaceae bacterium]|nr:fructose-1,6-bisphosphatase I / sedoheptulose-1,7-bisphosphatase [Methylophilaceae bacterium]
MKMESGPEMKTDRITLAHFLADPAQGPAKDSQLAELLEGIAGTVEALSGMIAQGALAEMTGKLQSRNVQGEVQMKLDVLSNDLFIERLKHTGLVQGLASEEMDDALLLATEAGTSPFLVIFDPLDGSSNVAVNVSIGSIFSVLAAPGDHLAETGDYLRAGKHQLAAGYALYGPSTMLVITVGKGTHGFTLDRESRDFVLTHPAIRIPEDTAEFAINASNERFWEPPVKRYINECKAGASDVRAKDFNMRWVASMVADIHRILMRGGIYLYPRDSKDMSKPGRLRLMYEANPMGMLVEQAGGLASTCRERILEIEPQELHQRVPIAMGSRNEVLKVERYHEGYDSGHDENEALPLFSDRSFYI